MNDFISIPSAIFQGWRIIPSRANTENISQKIKLLDAPHVLNSLAEPKFPCGQPTSIPNLYFIGYVYSHRGHLLEANEASRRVARVIQNKLTG